MTHTTQTYKFALWFYPNVFAVFETYEEAWKESQKWFEATGRVACVDQIAKEVT